MLKNGYVRHAVVAAAVSFCALIPSNTTAHAEGHKLKAFLSLSFTGNTWMEESKNSILALAKSKDFKDRVSLEVQVSGVDAQKQIQQIDSMVEAGADIIVVFPISPTALNRSIKHACDKGVMVVAFDASVEEKCATNVHVDIIDLAAKQAEWLAKTLKGNGRVIMLDGISGNTANDARVKAVKQVFGKFPGIVVAAEADGQWSQPGTRAALNKILAVHKWSDFDAIFSQYGCFVAAEMEDESGIPDGKKIPCAGNQVNGDRVQMLPAGTQIEGAKGSYRPMGVTASSNEDPTTMMAISLMKAVVAKESNEKLPHDLVVSSRIITNETLKICAEGTWKELNAGCNVFSPAMLPDPGSNAAPYSPELPQLGLQAAMRGTPEY